MVAHEILVLKVLSMSVYLKLLLAPKKLLYHFNSGSEKISTFEVCTNRTLLWVYKQHDMGHYRTTELASITLESEVMIQNPQCAIIVSARLEHFLHCKYCSQFSDHMKLLSRSNCLFSGFNSKVTPFYGNYFPYHNSQLLWKHSSEIGFCAAK